MDRLLKKVFFIPFVFRKHISRIIERLTGEIRVLPDFIIIGAQKCGTSSLYAYLMEHPYVVPTFKAEVHYFDSNYEKGIRWYKSNFPTQLYQFLFKFIFKRKFLTGEKTPYYIFHPHAIKRIRSVIPNVKIVLLLRNPVNRSYSHYNHEIRYNREPLSFEAAIKVESKRLEGELEKMIRDENYKSSKYSTYSYLARSIYIQQIEPLFNTFPKDQILIIKTEEFFQDPQQILNEVYRFLNLPYYELTQFKKYNFRGYSKLNEATRNNLKEYFKPFNNRLYSYLDRNFDWENE